ncbi:hypothetical protein [Streptomyces sp. DHE17-7]|uniref:hypothetical protein n=1 Tax=Streptomyces sp. DHE17-7 TaxID=2759949 RepID=UPI0022EAB5C9|nr:hypothetical protein [Streptomyces sp. DHE17-7]MBJ6618931.1 hypothetical protein [Streptomyces sp. DHE17-7]
MRENLDRDRTACGFGEVFFFFGFYVLVVFVLLVGLWFGFVFFFGCFVGFFLVVVCFGVWFGSCFGFFWCPRLMCRR